MGRRLIVNADDFGWTRDVNQGILRARRDGILRSTTLMANGAAFDDAVELARAHPDLDIGVHLTLVGGPAVSGPPGTHLPVGIPQLTAQLLGRWNRMAIEEEFAAQIEKIQAAGIRPTHLDTHKHTHLIPTVLDAAAAVGRRYSIRWIRRPIDLTLPAASAAAPLARRLTSRALRLWAPFTDRRFRSSGLRAVDHFVGFQMTGFYDAADLASLIQALPEGTTEFMCHPGIFGDELAASHTRLKQSREQELNALTSQEVLTSVSRTGVELCGFCDLA